MRRSDKLKNIEELNKRLLGESFHIPDGTPIGVNSKHEPIKEGSGPGGRVSFQTMIDKLNIGKQLGEPDLSMMVDEVITDLKIYLDYDVIKKDDKGMSDNDRLNWFGGR